MLSITTQMMLAEHLRLISECELEVELIREVLSEQRQFDASLAYLSLTKSKSFKIGLSSENFQDFFSSNSIPFKPKELNRLVRCYDSDGDQYLSFQDFLNFILPSNSASLRNITPLTDVFYNENGFLTYELVWALLRVFEKEVENNRRIKSSLKQLRSRYDFNIFDAFSTIDLEDLGYLDADAIHNFFVKNKLKITDNEILYLFRKFDKDQDGKISYKEFENEINMLGINKTLPRMTPGSHNKSSSKLKSPLKNTIYSSQKTSSLKKTPRKETPLKKTPQMSSQKDAKYLEHSLNSIKEGLRNSSRKEENLDNFRRSSLESPERVSVSRRRLYQNYEFNQQDSDEILNRDSPLREIEEKIRLQSTLNQQVTVNNSLHNSTYNNMNPLLTGNLASNGKNEEKIRDFQGTFGSGIKKTREFSGFKSGSPLKYSHNSSNMKKKNALNENDEKELVRALKLQIDLDREIESTKNELSLQTDFNLLEAFKRFDLKGNGYLSLHELNRAFARLDIHLSDDETFVFLKRYDKTMENVLRYSDFCEIFTPRSEEFHHILSSRSPGRNKLGGSEFGFSEFTKRLIQKIVLQILETEKTCNNLKKQLAARESFTLHDAFTVLDRDENGYISIDEFRAILNDYDIIPTTSDLISLMKRYDKNRDGKVTFSEFMSEMTPKKN